MEELRVEEFKKNERKKGMEEAEGRAEARPLQMIAAAFARSGLRGVRRVGAGMGIR